VREPWAAAAAAERGSRRCALAGGSRAQCDQCGSNVERGERVGATWPGGVVEGCGDLVVGGGEGG